MSRLFVNGTLMRGLALHDNLRGASFLREARTAPAYRLFSIGDVHPGMFRDDARGRAIDGELFDVPPDVLQRVVDQEPEGLYVGDVELEDGERVPGVLFPPALTSGHLEITHLGGWRAYLATT